MTAIKDFFISLINIIVGCFMVFPIPSIIVILVLAFVVLLVIKKARHKHMRRTNTERKGIS